MAYDRKKNFEEPLQKVLDEIKERQSKQANLFDELINHLKNKDTEIVDDTCECCGYYSCCCPNPKEQ